MKMEKPKMMVMRCWCWKSLSYEEMGNVVVTFCLGVGARKREDEDDEEGEVKSGKEGTFSLFFLFFFIINANVFDVCIS